MKNLYLIKVWSSKNDDKKLIRSITEGAWTDEEALAFDNIYRTNDNQFIEIFRLNKITDK